MGASKTGKPAANPMKPALAAKLKLSQGTGGGLKQGKGGANFVSKAKAKGPTGIKQTSTTAKKPAATRKGVNKLQKAPISAQPKGPKNNAPQAQLHNTVTKQDVARLRKANSLAMPPMTGGKFKNFIGA